MANDTSDGDTPGQGLAQEIRPCPYIRDGDFPPDLIRKIKACAVAITGDRNAADDILQQVRLKLLGVSKDTWDAVTRKWGYVIVIAQNESRSWLRRAQREELRRRRFMNRELFNIDAASTGPSGAPWDIQDLIRLFKPLGRERAEAYIRVRIYGRSVQSAALQMNLPREAVQDHVDAADLHFVDRLEGDAEGRSVFGRLSTLFRGRRS